MRALTVWCMKTEPYDANVFRMEEVNLSFCLNGNPTELRSQVPRSTTSRLLSMRIT